MRRHVFISHSQQDKAAALAACRRLEAEGIRCWIAPRDIRPGADWGSSIVDGIKKSSAFVLVFSRAANASPHIGREVERAVNFRVPIVPIRVEDAVPEGNLEYHLGTVQWLDAFDGPLEPRLETLAESVRRVVEPPPLTGETRVRQMRAAVPVATPEPVRASGPAPAPGPLPPVQPELVSTAAPPPPTRPKRWVRVAKSAVTALAAVAAPSLDIAFSGEQALMLSLGLLFGLVVVMWRSPRWRDALRPAAAVFVAASIASALLAFPTSRAVAGGNAQDSAPLFGAIYLGLAIRLVLRVPWSRAGAAVFGALILYLASSLVLEAAGLYGMILTWQTGFLLGALGTVEVFVRRLRGRPLTTAADAIGRGWTGFPTFVWSGLAAIGLVVLVTGVTRQSRAAAAQRETFAGARMAVRVPGSTGLKTKLGSFALTSYYVSDTYASLHYASPVAGEIAHTVGRRDTEARAYACMTDSLPPYTGHDRQVRLSDLPLQLIGADRSIVGSLTPLYNERAIVIGWVRADSTAEAVFWSNGPYCLWLRGPRGEALRFQRLLGY